MLIPEAIEKAGKELLEKAIVEGGRAMADKAGLDYDRLVSELTHLGEATYKEMPEIARNIRAEMREAIDRKIADELECSRRTGSTSSMNCIQNTFRSRWRPTRTCSKPILS